MIKTVSDMYQMKQKPIPHDTDEDKRQMWYKGQAHVAFDDQTMMELR